MQESESMRGSFSVERGNCEGVVDEGLHGL